MQYSKIFKNFIISMLLRTSQKNCLLKSSIQKWRIIKRLPKHTLNKNTMSSIKVFHENDRWYIIRILATTDNIIINIRMLQNLSETYNNIFRLFEYIAHIVEHWHQELEIQFFLFLVNRIWIQLIWFQQFPRFQHGKDFQRLWNASKSCIKK